MDRPTHQTELPLTQPAIQNALPEDVGTQCRQLIAQLLRQVLLAEKPEVHNEH